MAAAVILSARSSCDYQLAGQNGLAAVRSFICHEEPQEYQAVASAGRRVAAPTRDAAGQSGRQDSPAQRQYPLERSLRQADALALSLRAGLERLAIPLARAAAAFTQRQTWTEFGFARSEDHARERFGRSGRWVKECAALGRALESLPLLAGALTGDDGGRPIGRVAAALVGQVASVDSLCAWVTLARSVPVRALREAVRAARAAGSAWPIGAGTEVSAAPETRLDSPEVPDETDDLSDRSLVRIPVPAPVLAAFDEAVDLHRCVEGREATVTSFVEALVGEACSAGLPPNAENSAMKRSPDLAVVESALACSTDNWRHLPSSSPASWSLALAGVSLARLREIERAAGSGGAADLDGQIRALIGLENNLHNRLAGVLTDMVERGAWPRLRFAGVGHYAEERLGVSRTSAEDRVRAVRTLRQLPLLRAACEEGRVGFEATLLILRVLGRGPVGPDVERAWVARAEETTVKRLRDEARALGRRGSGRPSRDATPLDDAAWHGSLRREPGTARDRVHRFGMEAAASPAPDVFLRLRLPHELAGDLLGAIETSRACLSELADSVPWNQPWPDAGAAPSVVAARTFSVRSRRVPAWVGFLALLEDFVRTWDPVERGRRTSVPARPGDLVYSRAGWRCTAPGCTSRRNLEDHRSHRGGDDLSNRTCLCRFHHQRGEHGDLASCRGRAPLHILWRLGRRDLAVWYRNERRVVPGSASRRRAPDLP